MAVPSSLTQDFGALLSTTLYNYRRTIADNISTSNVLLYYLMKVEKSGYVPTPGMGLGERAAIPLMYGLAPAESYSGYDTLVLVPTDGITTAFYQWRQAAVPIMISRIELRKNAGDNQVVALLKAKVAQAELGIQDYFGKALIRGNGDNTSSQIATARTNSNNGSTFIDPLFMQVSKDGLGTVGNIDPSTNVWWKNQFTDFTAVTTFAGLLKNLRKLFNNCSKGPGGAPNLVLMEQQTRELYEAALYAQFRATDYRSIDIPFDNVQFRGAPAVWDEFMPDVGAGTLAVTKGSVAMLNTKFWQIQYDPETNFLASSVREPVDGDSQVQHILWYGAALISQRRKQGVGINIDLTIAA